jgi:GNAT superfamily N-acetyltransferase
MKIEYLAENLHCLEQIAEWCCKEWPWYYNNGELAEAISYHRKTAQKSTIPFSLVALERNRLIGTISVIEEDMETRPELTPWLGCLFVDPSFRGGGIATALIKEAVRLAAKHKITKLYAWTETLGSTLSANKWQFIEDTVYRDKKVKIYYLDLTPSV